VQWVADAVHVVRAADSTELAQPLAAEARRHGLLTIVRSALEAIDFLLDEPAVRPLLREVSATRRPLLERVAMSNGGAMLSPARSAAASLLRHGGGGEGVISRASGLARELLDLDHVSRPVAYSVYVASGRRPGIAALARRRWPALVRPSRVPSTVPAAGADLDFTSATTGDRHAGPGWWKLDELGLWSHGAEGRIVVDLTVDGEDDVELGIVACSYNQQPRPVQVRVNEKVVARVTVGPRDAPTELRVHVPADVAWRFRPMEIGFLAPPSGPRLRRGRVGVRVQRVRITPNGSLRETGLPAPPSGSPRGGG
jgi:hypothetical protein